MRRGFTRVPMVGVLLLGALLAGLVPAAAVQDASEPHVLRVNWGPPIPDSLDPQLSHRGQWGISGGMDYEGLTRLDDELNAVPGAAESWEFSPDGTTLTFHLRDGLVFSDGVPVTAAHFVYAAKRLCSPELDSASADLLFGVVGCEERFTSRDTASGTPAADDATVAAAKANFGVRALDDRTVEYRFDNPAPYFPVTSANWGTIPLREDLVAAGGPEWWATPETRIGNGPFRMVAYDQDEPDQLLVYARNDRYWGGPTKLDSLEFYFAEYGDPATMDAYRNGEFDINWPPEEALTAIESDPVLSRELLTIPIAGTIYYAFNLTREPFQDPKVREAFAYAFDREAYCRQLVFGACRPTLSWVSPGASGYIETNAFAFDPVKAREALAASSYGGPENLPEITWYNVAGEPSMAQDANWLVAQYRDVLGVELNVVELPEEEYDALFESDATWPQFNESTWFAGAETRGWFVVWRCGSDFNRGYCNPELESLLDRADAEMDPARRVALYQEAGHLLVADAPAVFVHNASMIVLVKPYVVGYSRTTPNDYWPGWANPLTVDVVRRAG